MLPRFPFGADHYGLDHLVLPGRLCGSSPPPWHCPPEARAQTQRGLSRPDNKRSSCGRRVWERAVPHSRLNGLSQKALEGSGYEILTRSRRVGVDVFIRDTDSLFVFLQGHPEYDATTLLLEHQRDLRRFIQGDQAAPPLTPSGAFRASTAAALNEICARAAAMPSERVLSKNAEITARAPPEARWSAWSDQLYRDWFDLLTEGAARCADTAAVTPS